ncbi:tryptophan dimethylallyltransferase family protein [Streptomyces sp. NPDC057430]|uniref:tryptophan dimethylallyltransferase family protein n=1 Tax=unclassified Streptomyces TaxID=2593676 RepID=UPI0036C4F72F
MNTQATTDPPRPVPGTVSALCGSALESIARTFGPNAWAEQVREAFDVLVEPWGTMTVRDLPFSDVSPDGSPVEYAITLTGDTPVLQLAMEPLVPHGDYAARAEEARRVMSRLSSHYGAQTERWARVADLFLPREGAADHVAMYGLEAVAGRPPQFKVWFYPQVRGIPRAPELVAEALVKLGLGEAWGTVLGHAYRGFERDRPALFSLDLTSSPTVRTKVYFRHYDSSARHISTICGEGSRRSAAAARDFCTALAGDAGLGVQPPVTCLTLTQAGRHVGYSVTPYVPLWTAAPDDAVIRARIGALLASHGASPTRYEDTLHALARRPLSAARGLHNYVSLQLMKTGPRIKVYLSPELLGSDPPARYQ